MHHMIFFSVLLAFWLGGCMHEPIHQGNRLDDDKINMVKAGDTKFTIEQRLGSPALNNVLHPHRLTYHEEFEDEDTGDMHKRGMEIIYDNAWRAESIRRFGFKKRQTPKTEE